MANVIISPDMSLPVPVVGLDPGPDWANNIDACLSIIDSHNHTPGNGSQIPPSGLNINADLSFQIHNATLLRSARFSPQVSPLAGVSDLGCIYESGVDLYYNDGNGNQIRITQGGSVAGSSGTITGLPSGTASAAYSSLSGTFIFQQATSTAANMDIGTLILRYPGSYPTPSGNYIALQAPTTLATGFAYTLPAALPGSSGALLTSNTSGSISYTNADNSTIQLTSSTLSIKPQGVTQGLLALRTTGTTVVAGGVAISASSGSFSTSAITPDPVTNLSVTITTTGRPVYIQLIDDGSGSASHIRNNANNALFACIFNGVTQLTNMTCEGSNGTVFFPTSSISYMDLPAAGTYTYTFQIYASGGTVFCENVKLLAYEI